MPTRMTKNSGIITLNARSTPSFRPRATNVPDTTTKVPESNRTALGIWGARSVVREAAAGRVPAHLRDAHYQGAKGLGHGKGYEYPHDDPRGWVPQQHLPDEVADRTFYEPSGHGHEQEIRRRMDRHEDPHHSADDG